MPSLVKAPCRPRSVRISSPKCGEDDVDAAVCETEDVQRARSSSMPSLSKPATGVSVTSKSRRSLTSVLTSKSVQDIVQKEVRKQLNNMSSHEHFLEQSFIVASSLGQSLSRML